MKKMPFMYDIKPKNKPKVDGHGATQRVKTRRRLSVRSAINLLLTRVRGKIESFQSRSSLRQKQLSKFTSIVLVAILVISLVHLLNPQKARAAILSQGPNSATASTDCTDDATVGTVAWTTPGNAFSVNTTYATVSLTSQTSHYIKCVNYGFSVPAAATITGVVIGVDRKTSGAGPTDSAVRLIKGGTIGTVDRSTTTAYTTSDAYEDHGSSNDLWGIALTPTDVNGATFGAAFSTIRTGSPARTVSVDHIRVTVYYSITTKVAQTGYIWENDDEDQATGDAYDENSQQEAGNTAITNVRQGERLTLRSQLKNTGTSAVNSTLGLFYDRNDGIWQKVKKAIAPVSASGTGCTATTWTCTSIDTANNVGQSTSVALDQSGNPWVSYYDTTGGDLRIAQYLGGATTGTGCAVNTWTCTSVDTTNNVGSNTSLAFDPSGNPWVSYYDTTNLSLRIARYLGGATSGTGCAVNTWTCTTVESTNNVGSNSAIAIDSYGNPWVAYFEAINFDLRLARYLGGATTGTGCVINTWTCIALDTTNAVGATPSIAFDTLGNPWVSNHEFTNHDLRVAQYLGGATTGTGCAVNTWKCTSVDTTNSVGAESGLAFDPSGNPWVSYYDAQGGDLRIAQYLGGATTGTGCAVNTWTCTSVDTANDVGSYTSLAFDPSGNPWVSYYDTTNADLRVAQYLGGATTGTGCAVNTWKCTAVDTTNSVGSYTSIAFDPNGNPWVGYKDATGGDLRIATISRRGEITMSPSPAAANGDALLESHADMTSVSDTVNRDNANCIGGGTWNNGKVIIAEEGTSPTLPIGSSTAQCTEVAFVINTSQATLGTTYRFVIATEDAWRTDKGPWRGSISTASYPTLTMASTMSFRTTKDVEQIFANCSASTNWGCVAVDNSGGNSNSMAFDPSGNPWLAYYDGGANLDLRVAHYLGGATTGTGCTVNTWTCVSVDTANDVGQYVSLAVDQLGNPWISYLDNTNSDLRVAQYLGGATTGTGCAINTWTCSIILASGTISYGRFSGLAIDSNGYPWVSSHELTNGNLIVSHYLGGTVAGSGCTITTWTCTAVATGNTSGYDTSLAISPTTGLPWVNYFSVTDSNMHVARYLGGPTSGTGCAVTTWTCETIEGATNYTGQGGNMTMDSSGNPWVTYFYNNNGGADASGFDDLHVAHYLGGATTGTGCDVNTWQCYAVDTNGVMGKFGPSIAMDSTNTPWVSYYEGTANNDLHVTHFLNGATTGTGCNINTWTCELVDSTNDVGRSSSLAFSATGTPWIAYNDATNGTVRIAKMHTSPTPLTNTTLSAYIARNAYRSSGRFDLSSGYSPRSTSTCSGIANLKGYCGTSTDDTDFDSITGTNVRPIYSIAAKNNNPASVPKVTWTGRSTFNPSTTTPVATSGDLVLQVYNFTSSSWVTLATDAASTNCVSADCTLSATIEPGVATQPYYQLIGTDYWVYFRFWQYENTSAETLYTDLLSVGFENTGPQLRGGTRFLNGAESGMDL